MSGHPAYQQAHADLDLWGNATAQGATPAPDLVMRSIIALRSVFNRHHPTGSGPVCAACGTPWDECPDARAVLAALGRSPEED